LTTDLGYARSLMSRSMRGRLRRRSRRWSGFGVLRPRLVTADPGGPGIARRALRPGREEFSLSSFGGNAGAESMRSRRLKIAKVERRKARAPLARCPPRLASAAQLAPPALRRPSSGEAARSLKVPGAAAPRERKALWQWRRRIPIRGRHRSRRKPSPADSDELSRLFRSKSAALSDQSRSPMLPVVEVLLQPAIVSMPCVCTTRAVRSAIGPEQANFPLDYVT
jgi:hypothetical protein